MTLRKKLDRAMRGTLGLAAAALIVAVATLHVLTTTETLHLVESKIRESIVRKGQSLVTNQAEALRGLVADNAFGDVRRMVETTVKDDPELAYGLFLDAQLRAWAYQQSESDGDKEPEAWKTLGIEPRTLLPDQFEVHQRHLFGQKIYEFAAPVRNEAGERVGAVRYGAWSRPLELALSRARRDSLRSLLISVGILSTLALCATLIGSFLIRRTADRITRPIVDLTEATSSLARGDRKRRVSIHSRDELEELGRSFNQMVNDLDESYARLEGLNRTLEQRVQERTQELGDRNRDLRRVLDTVEEGLLTISREGQLAPERSAQVDRWFGPYTGSMAFDDYFGNIDPDFAQRFRLGFEVLLEDFLPLELCLEQLPTRIRHARRDFEVSYLPLTDDGHVRGLLMVINDVTEHLLSLQQNIEQRELVAAFQALNRDRTAFMAFEQETDEILKRLATGSEELTIQKRLLHTLKGNAGLFSLDLVAQLCHRAEDEIEEGFSLRETMTLATLRSRWDTLSRSLNAFLGERGRDVVSVPAPELDGVCRSLAKGEPAETIIRRLQAWRCEPVQRPLERLAEYARSLCGRLGRGDLIVDIEGGQIRHLPERWEPLWSEMVHLIRNAVDHGIEAPEERRASGKPLRPRLRLGTALTKETFVVEVEDDGRGIDWEAIRRSARDQGLRAESEAELLSALLTDGVTSREQVSTTSGRGVGMFALHRQVQELGGEISVSTRAGEGTTWRLSFPASPEAASDDVLLVPADRPLGSSPPDLTV